MLVEAGSRSGPSLHAFSQSNISGARIREATPTNLDLAQHGQANYVRLEEAILDSAP